MMSSDMDSHGLCPLCCCVLIGDELAIGFPILLSLLVLVPMEVSGSDGVSSSDRRKLDVNWGIPHLVQYQDSSPNPSYTAVDIDMHAV